MARRLASRHSTASPSASQPIAAPPVASTAKTPQSIVWMMMVANQPIGWQTRYVRAQRR